MVHDGAVAVSAPGKVLLAGGYLVLDRAHTGLVFGLSARIHVLVQDVPTRNGVMINSITVNSPQFLDAVWEYGYRLTERNGGIKITQLRVDADLNLNRNPFIETTLGYVLSYIATISSPVIKPISVTILADNDYYSTPTEVSSGSDGSRPRFHQFNVPLPEAHKTGLGSSAALVTAITAALLSYYLPDTQFDLSEDVSRRRLHNLAQAAHCAAQGKVGSGFDIASAVYGSCLYRRFSPALLESHADPGDPRFASDLQDIVEESHHGGKWDTEIVKDEVKVPSGLRLIMCDVSCGSQTPGMVKKVLAWRKEKPDEANAIWTELQTANEGLARELKALAESSAPNNDRNLDPLRNAFTRIRRGIRLMSERSGVPIEPPPQTYLIDACEKIEGVIGGVVPGAGGYDAVSILVEDREDVISSLKKLFASWKFDAEGGGGKVSMLSVREEMEGVRSEAPKAYTTWTQ